MRTRNDLGRQRLRQNAIPLQPSRFSYLAKSAKSLKPGDVGMAITMFNKIARKHTMLLKLFCWPLLVSRPFNVLESGQCSTAFFRRCVQYVHVPELEKLEPQYVKTARIQFLKIWFIHCIEPGILESVSWTEALFLLPSLCFSLEFLALLADIAKTFQPSHVCVDGSSRYESSGDCCFQYKWHAKNRSKQATP